MTNTASNVKSVASASILASVFGTVIAPKVQGKELLVVGASTAGLLAHFAPSQAQLLEPERRRTRAAQRLLDSVAGDGSTPTISWKVTDASLQNLRLSRQGADEIIARHRVLDWESHCLLAEELQSRANAKPFIEKYSCPIVLLDLVANRVDAAAWGEAMREAYRVVALHGSVMLTALVADAPMHERVITQPQIYEGDLFFPTEQALLASVTAAGFYGMQIEYLSEQAVDTIAGVEVRAVVLSAKKGKEGVCLDQGHAVVYLGPWSAVEDDDGHRYVRGTRAAVCAKTYGLLMQEPYRGEFVGVNPPALLPLENAPFFDCNTPATRAVEITRGERTVTGEAPSQACGDSGCC